MHQNAILQQEKHLALFNRSLAYQLEDNQEEFYFYWLKGSSIISDQQCMERQSFFQRT